MHHLLRPVAQLGRNADAHILLNDSSQQEINQPLLHNLLVDYADVLVADYLQSSRIQSYL